MTGIASASGRAACQYSSEARLSCFAEQRLWQEGPLGWWAGVRLVTWPVPEARPYSLATLDFGRWWALAEVQTGVRWTLAVGIRW